MKSYPKYKDSGIQWIGQIPEGWGVLRFKHCFNTSTGMNIAKSDLSDSGVAVISYGQIHAKTNTRTHLSDDLLRYIPCELIKGGDTCKLRKNDIVFADTSEDLEGCGNAVFIDTDKEIFAGYHTIIARPIIEGEIKYLAYLFNTPVWRQQLRENVVGIKVYSITQRLLNDSVILLPPLSEQESIVRYLDDKTAKIDETVNLLEQQKADLQQYRKALISQTVTRGLNPNAKLKESGISWIGQIPETWKINRIKHFSKIQTGNTPSTAERRYFDGNVNWFTPGDFKGTFVIDNSARKLTQDAVNNNACRIFPANSIYLIGIGGSLGKIAFSEKEASANQQIIVISPNETIISKYIAYFLSTKRNIFELMANAATLPILSNGSVANMDVPIPPLSEQQEIVEYLDTKTAKIDEAIRRIDEQIADLRAYRAALISDVVTGKIDVRN